MDNKINTCAYIKDVVRERLRLNRQPDASEMEIKLFSGVEVNAMLMELMHELQPAEVNSTGLGRVRTKKKR